MRRRWLCRQDWLIESGRGMVEVEVVQQPEGYVLVRLAGEIDMSHRAEVQKAFDEVLDAGRAAVVVDLCDLRFLGVAGIDRIHGAGAGLDRIDVAGAELRGQGRSVRVVCADRGAVWRIVSLLGLDRQWAVHHDLTRAVASLTRDG